MDALLNAVTIKPDGWMIALSIGAALLFAAIMSTILMDLIQSNLALSLGMLGSLSIVRFRTNIKDPRDIGFIFWAMAIGIASATQSYLIGIIGSVVLGAVMIITKKRGEAERQFLLVIRGSNTDLDGIQNVVKSCTRTNLVKAKNILSDSFELVYEIQIPEKNGNQVIENIFELGGVDSVNLLAQNGCCTGEPEVVQCKKKIETRGRDDSRQNHFIRKPGQSGKTAHGLFDSYGEQFYRPVCVHRK